MKTVRVLGFDLRAFFSVRRVKRMTFNLPDWADDTCITKRDVDDNPIPHKIEYYKGSTRFYIDLPKCNEAREVSLTPIYGIIDGKRAQMTDRKITVDVFINLSLKTLFNQQPTKQKGEG